MLYPVIDEFFVKKMNVRDKNIQHAMELVDRILCNLIAHIKELDQGQDKVYYFTPALRGIRLKDRELSKDIVRQMRILFVSCCVCNYTYFLNNRNVIQRDYRFLVLRIGNSDDIESEIIDRFTKYITDETYRKDMVKDSLAYEEIIQKPLVDELNRIREEKLERKRLYYENMSDDQLCWIKANTLYEAYCDQCLMVRSEISNDPDHMLFHDYGERFARSLIVSLFHRELMVIKMNKSEEITIRTPPTFIMDWKLFSKIYPELKESCDEQE